MVTDIRRAVTAVVVFTVVVGLLYPLAVWAVGQTAFRGAAQGSLVAKDGEVVGSALVGQAFDAPEYFWGRPSAAGDGYDASASGASNLGPTSAELDRLVRERRAALLRANPGAAAADVPAELVTASGSGLDPDVSPAAARFQVHRVAAARAADGIDAEQLRALIDRHTKGRTLGVLGEPRVNVLELNLALDELARSRG